MGRSKGRIGLEGKISLVVLVALFLSVIPVVSANQPPVAVARPYYQEVYLGETAFLYGDWSYDPDGWIVDYYWEFGDGENASEENTSHIYPDLGLYIVTLQVWDNESATDTYTAYVRIVSKESPYIKHTNPGNNYTGVTLDHDITIQFNELINTSTFTYSISPDPGGWAWSWYNYSGNQSNFSIATGVHNDFTPWTTYTFEVTYAEDLDGNTLVLGHVPNPWNFTTGGPPDDPPVIEVIEPGGTPGQVYDQGDNITIFWDAYDDNPLPPNPINISYGNPTIGWIPIVTDYPNYEIYDWNTSGVPYGHYWIAMSVRDSAGQESNDMSNYSFEITCDDCLPGAPKLVSAVLTGASNQDVTITWELSSDDGAGEDDVVKYEIYYGTSYAKDGSGYSLLVTLAPGSTTYTHADGGDGDLSDYFYYVQVEDAAGQTTWEGQAGKYVKALEGDYRHMVSVPLVQADTSLLEVLKTIEGSYFQIMLYQGTCANRQWEVFKPGWTKSLYIDHKMSFFIKMQADDNLVVAGLVPESTTITLCQGAWNLIGYPSFTPDTVGNVLSGISHKGVKVITKDRPQHMIRLSDSDIMSAGNGYWIKVLTQQTLVIYN